MNPFVSACLSCVLLYSYVLFKASVSLNLSLTITLKQLTSSAVRRHNDSKIAWKKVPSHIAAIFPRNLTTKDVQPSIDLIDWCEKVDEVKVLSLYDVEGKLLELIPEISKRLETGELTRCIIVNLVAPPPLNCHGSSSNGSSLPLEKQEEELLNIRTPLMFKGSSCCSEERHFSKDEVCQQKLIVNVLSGDMGYPYFTRAVKRHLLQREGDERLCTHDELYNQILPVEDITEPQLMLCLNEPLGHDTMTANQITLDQFPPWLLRLTEFYKVPRPFWRVLANKFYLLPSRLTKENFLFALSDYSNTSQRFGK